MTMVVEGVEDAATLTALPTRGCEFPQGHHIARPLPAGSFLPWLTEQPSHPPRAGLPQTTA